MSSIKYSDCLIVDNTLFWKLGDGYLDVALSQLDKWRKQVGRIVWFDTGDSTGEFEYKIMDHVDLYLKAYCLKDKSLYRNKYHENRIWADYYFQNRALHLGQPIEGKETGLDIDINKIKTGWNYYLGAFYEWSNIVRKFGWLAPYINRRIMRFVSPDNKRSRSVSMRCGARYVAEGKDYEMVAWQRKAMQKRLQKLNIETNVLSRRLYFEEIKRSRIGISPFGWGEICLRDYEVFLNGAMLMKPRLDHLETWPDLYKPNITYVPFQWDLSDLETAIETSLLNETWMVIATASQKLYKHYISDQGLDKFCEMMIQRVVGE